eukprot:CAMPEP_0179954352 /NCGR_PEP_ID=MMETSP0983-20121128/25441_1 /TAXON_ID=483367 /ORGANISM="non described non described, Strain CCMP 2436" /LENGTH=135 /DNA_ID=CAMNT_0021865389 /DNA_START=163 /DNA_END=569 /DNA_ORIENTATION=+
MAAGLASQLVEHVVDGDGAPVEAVFIKRVDVEVCEQLRHHLEFEPTRSTAARAWGHFFRLALAADPQGRRGPVPAVAHALLGLDRDSPLEVGERLVLPLLDVRAVAQLVVRVLPERVRAARAVHRLSGRVHAVLC